MQSASVNWHRIVGERYTDVSDKTLPFLTLKTKAADSNVTLVLSWKTVKLSFEFQRMVY
jgi:hypothetical protein